MSGDPKKDRPKQLNKSAAKKTKKSKKTKK